MEAITKAGNEMEIEEVENLPKLFISPIEKLIDKFKAPKNKLPLGSLHQ